MIQRTLELSISKHDREIPLDELKEIIPAETLEKFEKVSVGCVPFATTSPQVLLTHVGLKVHQHHVHHFTSELFNSTVEWINGHLYIAVHPAPVIIVPQNQVFLYGAAETALLKLFGPRVHAAVTSAELLTKDTPKSKSVEVVLASRNSDHKECWSRLQVHVPDQHLSYGNIN